MRLLLMVVIAACIACGGGGGDGDDGPSCAVAVNRAARRTKDSERAIDRMVGKCEREAWTAERRRCIANAEDEDDLERCGRKARKVRESSDDDDDDDRRKKKRRRDDDDEDYESDMERVADDMCACRDLACAKRVMDRAVDLSMKNAGKDVSSRRARRYEQEQKRIVGCMEALSKVPDKPTAYAVDTVRAPTAADLATYTSTIYGSGKLRAVIGPMGPLSCELFEDKAPVTVANFIGLATGKKAWRNPGTGAVETGKPFYTGLIFHRVIPGFMIQGGDPLGTGLGGPGYTFGDEVGKGLTMDAGMLAMANSGPATNGSQFFVMEARAAWLDDKHTIFGKCDDVDLVKKIANVPRGRTDKPDVDVTIRYITIRRY